MGWLPYLLVSLLLGGVALLPALALYRSARALEQLARQKPQCRWARWEMLAAGHACALLSLACLLAANFPSVLAADAAGRVAGWEVAATAALIAAVGLLASVYVVQLWRGWRTKVPSIEPGSLGTAATGGLPPAETPAPHPEFVALRASIPAPAQRPFAWWRDPLGVVAATMIVLAILSVCWLIMDALNPGLANLRVHAGSALVMAVSALVLLTGLILLRASQCILATRADSLAERSWLIAAQRNLARFYLCLAIIILAAYSALPALVAGIVLLGTWGAVRQAAHLRALWLLATTFQHRSAPADELAAQAEHCTGRTRRLLQRAASQLAEGKPVSHVLYHSGIVPRSAWLETAGALSAGKVPEVLRAIAARETARFSSAAGLHNSQHMVAYWSVVYVVMLAILAFLMVYIIPKLRRIFQDFDAPLPNATHALLAAVDTTAQYWYLVLPAALLPWGLLLRLEVEAQHQGWLNTFERRLGPYWVRLRAPDLLRGLRWAVAAQRPLEQALAHMASVPLPTPFRARLYRAAQHVAHGEDPWLTLHAQGWLTASEAELLRTAQQNHHLPWALETLSHSTQSTREYRLAVMAEWLHPAVLLATGCIVGAVVYCLFVPLVYLILTMAEHA
uniref:Type II secretion system protein GspF domain-containing protein n=1 Tax=Schlesneria paludicola TaxID=360056 RepID=A0A7C4QPD5_9PLAN